MVHLDNFSLKENRFMMFIFQEKIFGVWAIYDMELNHVVKKGHGKLNREIISSFFQRKMSKHKIFSKYMA